MGYFSLNKSKNGYFICDTKGAPFLSVGLNHTDETNLLFSYNIDIWKNRYGSHKAWLQNGLVRDLNLYGFNTIGWTQDVIATVIEPHMGCIHSEGFSFEDYQQCNTPYCVNLEIANIEHWNTTPVFPDVFSVQFKARCEYLSRHICARHSESENLVGYFFNDIPSFGNHTTGLTFPQLVGLNSDSDIYERLLSEIVEKYYDTITQTIKVYDNNHLILGDRFNGNHPDNQLVYKIASKFCDIISIQYFNGDDQASYRNLLNFFREVHSLTGKPLLLADIGSKCPTELNPSNNFGPSHLKNQSQRAEHYIKNMELLLKENYFVGWHWCAYIENEHRGWGIKSYLDEPYIDFLKPVSEFNKRVTFEYRERHSH